MLKVNMKTGETEQCSLLDLMEGGVKELADRDLQRVSQVYGEEVSCLYEDELRGGK